MPPLSVPGEDGGLSRSPPPSVWGEPGLYYIGIIGRCYVPVNIPEVWAFYQGLLDKNQSQVFLFGMGKWLQMTCALFTCMKGADLSEIHVN